MMDLAFPYSYTARMGRDKTRTNSGKKTETGPETGTKGNTLIIPIVLGLANT
jgi:hypothetical protein